MDDGTKPGVERMKPCPFCQGRGSVSAERDTVRWTKEEADAMRASAVKTPTAPKPEGGEVTVQIPATVPFVGLDMEDDEVKTPVRRLPCTRCGGDRKIRCQDAECVDCAMDHYCENSTWCPACAVAVGTSMPGRQHDLLPIILALVIAAVVSGGLALLLGYTP